MKQEILSRLKGTVVLDELDNLKFVSTGNYALNKIISGEYTKGIPIGGPTQLRGDSSVGKTLFAASILSEAIKQGYYALLLDAENAFSKKFAQMVGIDTSKLWYSCPETVEDAFISIEESILAIRGQDKKTPIVIVLDSLAVLPVRDELVEKKKDQSNYEANPMEGALRAKITGSCLRKVNPHLRKNDVALVIINQHRNKITMFGDPTTNASGGMALQYYLFVDLLLKSSKTKDVILDDEENPLGIEVEIKCNKNKCAIPFKTTRVKVKFDKGVEEYSGLLDSLVEDGKVISKEKGRYQVGSTNFTENQFVDLLLDKNNADVAIIRDMLGIKL